MQAQDVHIAVKKMDLCHEGHLLLENIHFEVKRRDIFVIMGQSGCGKSTLMRTMVGLERPVLGDVFFNGFAFWRAQAQQQQQLLLKIGVMFQQGALWSSMTLAENVALPLRLYTHLSSFEISDVVEFKLSLVGLSGFGDYFPAEISGGMRKRVAIARAMALDPEILFFDEPSAGLDPVNSRRLDDLIVQLSESLGTTVVIVTHELASIFAIATNAIFLDAKTKSITGKGKPQTLLDTSNDRHIIQFLTREVC